MKIRTQQTLTVKMDEPGDSVWIHGPSGVAEGPSVQVTREGRGFRVFVTTAGTGEEVQAAYTPPSDSNDHESAALRVVGVAS